MTDSHPSINHAKILQTLCDPLQKLGVVFFGYTDCDAEGNTTCLGSDPYYAEQYIKDRYFDRDIHVHAPSHVKHSAYTFWDYTDLDNDADTLYRFAADLGHSHTLTITQTNQKKTHCYHFSGKPGDPSINQNYLSHLDALLAFVEFFNNKLVEIPELSLNKDFISEPTRLNPSHTSPQKILFDDLSINQLQTINNAFTIKDQQQQLLTSKELQCLRLIKIGKSAAVTAQLLGVSQKTIEKHIANIKRKLACYTQFQLGQAIAEKHINDWI